MRRRHFEALQPVCPVCRAAGDAGFALRVAQVAREEEGHILEGAIHCSNPNCLREYPIVDGVPLLVANIRQYVSDNLLPIYGRRDLSDFVESMLGDCCGPNSAFDQTRQHLSSYAWDHYGDLDPSEPSGEPRPGSMLRHLEIGRQLAGTVPSGPLIDAGCSVGRSSFALAEHSQELVLGVDLNFAMLRLARTSGILAVIKSGVSFASSFILKLSSQAKKSDLVICRKVKSSVSSAFTAG